MAKREAQKEGVLEGEPASKRPPHPKRKVAIMMGYCGSAYQGMQLNPGAKTIELELWNALVADGLVSKENSVDPKKIAWMRACRTDKGVHAAGQVVSVKILIKTEVYPSHESPSEATEEVERKALEATTHRLNAILPSDMRIFGIKRTVNSFHSKERCDSRYYEYLLPTYALAPASPAAYLKAKPNPFVDGPAPAPIDNGIQGNEMRKKRKIDSDDEAQELEDAEDPEILAEQMSADPAPDSAPAVAVDAAPEWVSKLSEDDRQLIKTFRIDSITKEKLAAFLQRYKGSHLYHNFTIGKDASDPSCRRNIFDVILGEPFMRDDVEWISVTFHGQSFMLHQIRKMIGLAILAIRLNCDGSIIEECFRPAKVNIPKAPALGLLLDKAIFKSYNTRNDSSRDAIDFNDFAAERIVLKNEMIYPKIFEEELKYNRFMGWLKCNDEHGSEFPFLIPFIPQ